MLTARQHTIAFLRASRQRVETRIANNFRKHILSTRTTSGTDQFPRTRGTTTSMAHQRAIVLSTRELLPADFATTVLGHSTWLKRRLRTTKTCLLRRQLTRATISAMACLRVALMQSTRQLLATYLLAQSWLCLVFSAFQRICQLAATTLTGARRRQGTRLTRTRMTLRRTRMRTMLTSFGATKCATTVRNQRSIVMARGTQFVIKHELAAIAVIHIELKCGVDKITRWTSNTSNS